MYHENWAISGSYGAFVVSKDTPTEKRGRDNPPFSSYSPTANLLTAGSTMTATTGESPFEAGYVSVLTLA